jgi:hypothetical protein
MKEDYLICSLCGERATDGRKNRMPPIQAAHIIANRFTADEPRYKGVRNPFTEEEWTALISTFGSEFGVDDQTELSKAKRVVAKATTVMCAECHEEVLSEPLYLPSFLRDLRRHFEGKKRIEKMVTLATILKLGLNELHKRVRYS